MLISSSQKICSFLLQNKIGIIPTDTIYGFATLLNNHEGIVRIFQIKKRSRDKKIPLLVASLTQLKQLIHVSKDVETYLDNCQQPTTVIYEFTVKNSFSLNKNPFLDKKTIAIRLVHWEWLRNIILKTGPLVVTSCNISGNKPLNTLKLLLPFANQVDFIVPLSALSQQPSRIFDWEKKVYLR